MAIDTRYGVKRPLTPVGIFMMRTCVIGSLFSMRFGKVLGIGIAIDIQRRFPYCHAQQAALCADSPVRASPTGSFLILSKGQSLIDQITAGEGSCNR